jgi:hypothetical protein
MSRPWKVTPSWLKPVLRAPTTRSPMVRSGMAKSRSRENLPARPKTELAQRRTALEHQTLGEALMPQPVEEMFLGQLQEGLVGGEAAVSSVEPTKGNGADHAMPRVS